MSVLLHLSSNMEYDYWARNLCMMHTVLSMLAVIWPFFSEETASKNLLIELQGIWFPEHLICFTVWKHFSQSLNWISLLIRTYWIKGKNTDGYQCNRELKIAFSKASSSKALNKCIETSGRMRGTPKKTEHFKAGKLVKLWEGLAATVTEMKGYRSACPSVQMQ